MTAAVWRRTMETQGCLKEQAGLALLCSALSLSLCFNMVLFLRRFSGRGEVSCPRSRPGPRGGAGEEPQEDGDSVYGNVGAESGPVDLGAGLRGQPWRSQATQQKLSYASLDHRAMQQLRAAPPPARHLLHAGVTLERPCRDTDSQRTIYLNRQQLLEEGAGLTSSLTPQHSVTG